MSALKPNASLQPQLESSRPYTESGKAIRKLLIDHDMNQGDLATAIGASMSSVNDWCQGRGRPSVRFWAPMGEVFGLTAEDVYRKLYLES